MNYCNFEFSNCSFTIEHTRETFVKYDRKCWPKKPESVTFNVSSPEAYTSYVTSIPFYNAFIGGYRRRAYWSYTQAGYLPTRIVTTSPDGNTKHVDYFDFKREA